MPNILILGGTTEASALAAALAATGLRATFSYAGRTASPRAQPLPVRIGGFGGIAGLASYLRTRGVTHVVDATHPFARQMSEHAVAATQATGVALAALTRPAWEPGAFDRWTMVPDIPAAVAALAGPSQRVMLALGRLHVSAFAMQPQHRYLLRFVDAPDEAVPLPDYRVVVDRGPFTVDADRALLREEGISRIVCKNAGGAGAQAKLLAARSLGVPVLMIDRPVLPERTELHEVAAVLRWIGHNAERGV